METTLNFFSRSVENYIADFNYVDMEVYGERKETMTEQSNIEQIIKEAVVCRIGLYDGKMPYIVPMNFGYRNSIFYFHSSPSGKKIEILKKNPDVCFEIDILGGIKKAKEACKWDIDYRSVMGEGKVVFIENRDGKTDALNIIMDHYSGRADWDFNEKMLSKTLIFKLEISSISMKSSDEN